MDRSPEILDTVAHRLGYAGLLAPVLALGALAYDPSLRWFVSVGAFAYAAFIFAFLGGIWWGMALSRRHPPAWVWFAAVAPSLISLALLMPWTFGWRWPEPQMAILSALILISPLVDHAITRSTNMSAGWLRLRWHLSIGLALSTLILSLL